MLALWVGLSFSVSACGDPRFGWKPLSHSRGHEFKRQTARIQKLRARFKLDLEMLQRIKEKPVVQYENTRWRAELFTFKDPFEHEEIEADPISFLEFVGDLEKVSECRLLGVPHVFLPFDFFRWKQSVHGSELNYTLTSIRLDPSLAFQHHGFKYDETAWVQVRLYAKSMKGTWPLADLILLREERAMRPHTCGYLKRESIRDLIEPPGWDRYTRIQGEDRIRYQQRRDLQSGHQLDAERCLYLEQIFDQNARQESL